MIPSILKPKGLSIGLLANKWNVAVDKNDIFNCSNLSEEVFCADVL